MPEAQRRPDMKACDFSDPDCLRCMRMKLNAISVAVFFREGDDWRLGNFQSDKPRSAAEAEFLYMLKARFPQQIAERGRGFILLDESDIAAAFPEVKGIFGESTLIASAVCGEEAPGIRIAWRDQSEPFTEADLEIIHCRGNCPDSCKAL